MPEKNLFWSQGPDGGFHTRCDQQGTYAGILENAETTSIAIMAISSLSNSNPLHISFLSIPSWIIYLYTGLAATAVAVVVAIIGLDQRKRRTLPPTSPK